MSPTTVFLLWAILSEKTLTASELLQRHPGKRACKRLPADSAACKHGGNGADRPGLSPAADPRRPAAGGRGDARFCGRTDRAVRLPGLPRRDLSRSCGRAGGAARLVLSRRAGQKVTKF